MIKRRKISIGTPVELPKGIPGCTPDRIAGGNLAGIFGEITKENLEQKSIKEFRGKSIKKSPDGSLKKSIDDPLVEFLEESLSEIQVKFIKKSRKTFQRFF